MNNHIHRCWCSIKNCDDIHHVGGRFCITCKKQMKNSVDLQDDVYLKACEEMATKGTA